MKKTFFLQWLELFLQGLFSTMSSINIHFYLISGVEVKTAVAGKLGLTMTWSDGLFLQ